MKCLRCGTELTTAGNGTGLVCTSCLTGLNKQPINTWQLCPKCAGQGKVWIPPDWPYNETYTTDGSAFECDVCKGKKVISTITGLSPS